jgi:hypothetical protein
VEWFKVKALSSSTSTAKKKKMYLAINGSQKFSSDAFLGYRVSTASNVF